ncbi:hypothetical protein Lmac_2373 [Legionella maceachernii]|uniref:Uncharacterized protein n=1 Tax=Legionella maceachernii TaxID=466 RepID=A0A0W0VX09_9GAMM|nr:hypothetical protein Lmac_2373 [Legionella maceachernii]SKA22465.1 hypothetical protein SAMN02745128_02662 [Legionella maceachernii]SUP01464.1 Uncharacterised protein [Legionella maceachernii]
MLFLSSACLEGKHKGILLYFLAGFVPRVRRSFAFAQDDKLLLSLMTGFVVPNVVRDLLDRTP